MKFDTTFRSSLIANTHITPVRELIQRNYSLAETLAYQAEALKNDADLANEVAVIFEDCINDIAHNKEKDLLKSFTNQALAKSIKEFNKMPDMLKSIFLYNYIINNVIIPKDSENPYHYKPVFDNISQALVKFTECVDDAEKAIKEYKEDEIQRAEYQPYNTYKPYDAYDLDYANAKVNYYWQDRLVEDNLP